MQQKTQSSRSDYYNTKCMLLKQQVPQAVIIYSDSQGAIAPAKNPESHTRTMHINIQFVHEQVIKKEVDLQYVPKGSHLVYIAIPVFGKSPGPGVWNDTVCAPSTHGYRAKSGRLRGP